MSPMQYLFLTLLATALAASGQAIATHARRRKLRGLARAWHMQFAACDQLRLSDRIAGKIPVPGAAGVAVRDLLFDTDGDRHRYLFTVEYGLGVVRGKRRRQRVAGFAEPVTRAGADPADFSLLLAPVDLELVKAYENVRESLK